MILLTRQNAKQTVQRKDTWRQNDGHGVFVIDDSTGESWTPDMV